MSRGTRQNAAATAELDEGPEPSSPAQPAANVTGLRQELERFTFLQSVIQKSFMLESEAKDMYIQLTDSETGIHLSSKTKQQSGQHTHTQCLCLLQMMGMRTLWQTSTSP